MPRLPPVTSATLPFKENSSREKSIAYLLNRFIDFNGKTTSKYISPEA
jgi:hypothetical protein